MSETIAGRYQLGDIIGTGGMSEVYVANDTVLGREVAVKMLRHDLARDETFRERFRQEAHNSGKLNHAAIVAVYDTGETDRDGLSTPYIVMELVRGQTLRSVIRDGGPMSPAEAARTLIPVCEGLQVSHEAGVVHRDIKPGNIMITNTGAPKVMDFGIARAVNDAASAMTQTSAVIGTAQYLSPEQARGKPVDARSDVYALGCVMYDMVTGQPPFQGESPFDVAYQHVKEDPRPPSELIPGLSPTEALNIDAVVLTAMAKHPGDRYQSATDMADDLQLLARGSVTRAARHYVVTEDHDHSDAGSHAKPPSADPTTVFTTQALPQEEPVRRAPATYPEDHKKGRKFAGAIFGAVAAIALALLGLFAYDALTGDISNRLGVNQASVTVPELVNVPQAQALSQLEAMGLRAEVTFEASPDIVQGNVIRTNPAAGSVVQENTTVTVTVSTGKEITEVPDLRGMNTATAAKALESAGLTLDPVVRETASDNVAEGDVVEQSPAAGSQISKGSRVQITVSTGVENQNVPALAGMDWEQAQAILRGMNFVPVLETVNSSEDEGTVISVEGQGTARPKGSQVKVQVSNGTMFIMPTITNMTQEEAFSALIDAGWRGTATRLVVGEEVKTGALIDDGRVAYQDVTAGTLTPRTGEIHIRLYKFDIGELAP